MKFMHKQRATRFVRSAAVLAIFTATGYVVGAVTHSAVAPFAASAALAQTVRSPQATARPSLPIDDGDAADGLDWARFGIQQYIQAPRECDANGGVTTECVFMD